MPIPTRQTDSIVLKWIKLRTEGFSSGLIAQKYGVSQERVRVATNRVLDDDIKHCGFNVAKEYWSRTRGPKK
jgi:hypothetical protein